MSIELERAPEVTIFEDGLEEIPDMVAHLYKVGSEVTLCGVNCKDDPHDQMHKTQRIAPGDAPLGVRACGKCGATICDACFALHS